MRIMHPGRYLIGNRKKARWVELEPDAIYESNDASDEILYGPGLALQVYEGQIEEEVVHVRTGQEIQDVPHPQEDTEDPAVPTIPTIPTIPTLPDSLELDANCTDEYLAARIRVAFKTAQKLAELRPGMNCEVLFPF